MSNMTPVYEQRLKSKWYTDARLAPGLVTGHAGELVSGAASDYFARLANVAGVREAYVSGLPRPVVLSNNVTVGAVCVLLCHHNGQGKLRGFALGLNAEHEAVYNGEYKGSAWHHYNNVTGTPQIDAAFAQVYGVLTNSQVTGKVR